MKGADKIRLHGKEKYVLPARRRKEKQFSISTGEVLREMNLVGSRAPAVCSALKTHEFLETNALRLVARTGPPSGQSTTVTYTYEFVDGEQAASQAGTNTYQNHNAKSQKRPMDPMEAWKQLRGSLKDVYDEYGGGEAYLRAERGAFKDWDTHK